MIFCPHCSFPGLLAFLGTEFAHSWENVKTVPSASVRGRLLWKNKTETVNFVLTQSYEKLSTTAQVFSILRSETQIAKATEYKWWDHSLSSVSFMIHGPWLFLSCPKSHGNRPWKLSGKTLLRITKRDHSWCMYTIPGKNQASVI